MNHLLKFYLGTIRLIFSSYVPFYYNVLLIFRRRRVSDLAAAHWPGKKPKFTSPQMKADLREFASKIAPKCEMLEIGFNVDAIMEHVKDYFSEQRRYVLKKNKKVFPLTFSMSHYCIRK